MIDTDSCVKLPSHYSGKFKGSFAYLSIKDRFPVILVKVVDKLCQDKNVIGNTYGEIGKQEVKMVIGHLSALQNEMITNKPMKELTSDGSDIVLWNSYLQQHNLKYDFPAAWFDSGWLYVECYLYRRIKEAFELSTVLKEYDPFEKQKLDSLLLAMDDILKLGTTLQQTLSNLQSHEDLYDLFAFYLEVSLWGNRCDLCLFAGKEVVPTGDPVEELRSKILINDTKEIWNLLKEANNKSGEVHIHLILDNAGFELFGDFCFLQFLQSAKLVSKVSIYVKQIPWYVSDTLEKDIQCLLETLTNSNHDVLIKLGRKWIENFKSGVWKVESEMFWTLPHDYSEMVHTDPKLYAKLSQGDLLIFKGDLNYRKLTGDRQWDETTSFNTALNRFLPTSLVSLRTIKSDVIVGLSPGTTEKLNNISLNWKFSGEYAVIQYAQKEK